MAEVEITDIRETLTLTPAGVFEKVIEITYKVNEFIGTVSMKKEDYTKEKALELVKVEAKKIAGVVGTKIPI